MNYNTIIIGGGMAGIYIASQMKEENFCLLECYTKVGGRHWTVRKDDKVLYEAGAWRVHSSHHRMLKLIKKYNLETTFLENSKKPHHYKESGLSKFDENLLDSDGDVIKAYEKELKSGYQNAHAAEAQTFPYDSKEGKFYTINNGQEVLIENMAKDIEKSKIKLNHKVYDICKEGRKYKLTVLVGHKKVITKTFYCNNLICCVPKYEALHWTLSKDYLLPILGSVGVQPLQHIYAQKTPNIDFSKVRVLPGDALQQIIKPTHDKSWFQISYSGGRIADFWKNLHLKHGKNYVKKLLEKYSKLKLEKIEMYYWANAYHYWVPVPEFKIKQAVNNSIQPSIVKLSNFYMAGECFSSYQGWSEGALETAEKVLDAYYNNKVYIDFYKTIPLKEYLIFDGYIIDVKRWKKVHPGSEKAITSHMKEDVSKLFRFIKHSEYSWAVLESLKYGAVQN